MKVCAVIAEFDPFHAGHAYLIEKASAATGCRVISVMSGCFLQRGTPAVQDKYIRAQASVMGGCSAVFELPTVFAASSARDFAEGAVRLLHRSGIVSHLAFGIESRSEDLLHEISDILSGEPEAFRETLRAEQKAGSSFPAARQAALLPYFNGREEALIRFLNKPNHILALEYLRAIRLFAPEIQPVPVLRSDNGYHSDIPKNGFVSAGTIRQLASENKDFTPYIPQQLISFYREHALKTDYEKSLGIWLNLLLSRASYSGDMPAIPDLSEALWNRVKKLPLPLEYEDILNALKEKNETRTRIARTLIRLLLDIREDTMQQARREGASYLNLLSFRKKDSDILKSISEQEEITLITKKADYRPEGLQKALWETDCYASALYHMLFAPASSPTDKPYSELTRNVIVVE